MGSKIGKAGIVAMLAIVATASLVGCVSDPSKDANLTDIYRPRPGITEASVPARALGIDVDGNITYKGDPEKNITIARREWHENGQPKSEFTATGDRVATIEATSAGIGSNEAQRIDGRLRQLEMSIAVFERTLDKALAVLPTYFPAPPSATAPAGSQSPSRRDQIIDALIERLLTGQSPPGLSLTGPSVPPGSGQ